MWSVEGACRGVDRGQPRRGKWLEGAAREAKCGEVVKGALRGRCTCVGRANSPPGARKGGKMRGVHHSWMVDALVP